MRFLCIDSIHYPPHIRDPHLRVDKLSRLFSDQVSKPFSIGVPLFTTGLLVDHLVTYVLYHTDEVSPDN